MSGYSSQKSGIEKLSKKVEELRGKIGDRVNDRIYEFRNNKNLFSELCFCILTANYTAEGGIRIQNVVNDFSKFSGKEISEILKKMGHRFPNARAGYIELAKIRRKEVDNIGKIRNSLEKREWLVKNIKGIGYKEASHFLRNIGVMNVAIIDRHILNVLQEYNIINKPKILNKKKYFEIEEILRKIAEKTKTEIGELDLYLWYMKTGKILK